RNLTAQYAARSFQERHRLQLQFLDGLQVIEHFLRLLAAHLGMEMQREAVRASRVDQFRLQSEERFDSLELAQHRGAEDIEPRSLFKQNLDNVPAAHVRGPAKS